MQKPNTQEASLSLPDHSANRVLKRDTEALPFSSWGAPHSPFWGAYPLPK